MNKSSKTAKISCLNVKINTYTFLYIKANIRRNGKNNNKFCKEKQENQNIKS